MVFKLKKDIKKIIKTQTLKQVFLWHLHNNSQVKIASFAVKLCQTNSPKSLNGTNHAPQYTMMHPLKNYQQKFLISNLDGARNRKQT